LRRQPFGNRNSNQPGHFVVSASQLTLDACGGSFHIRGLAENQLPGRGKPHAATVSIEELGPEAIF